MPTGIASGDFDEIYNDLAVDVSYEVVTLAIDGMTGKETPTYASATTKTVVFFLYANNSDWVKEGLLKTGDAYIQAKTSVGIAKSDRFTYNSQTYIIDSVTRRTLNGTQLHDFAVCFRVS